MILQGDCIEVLSQIEDETVDLAYADPPYNLQLKNPLKRPDGTTYENLVDTDWDRFSSLDVYEEFTKQWLTQVRRVMKRKSSLWVSCTYHCSFIIGYTLMKLNFEILNHIVWIKDNPTPNFSGTRFCQSHESLIWCKKKGGTHYFNYQFLKKENNNKQPRAEWYLPGPSQLQKEKIVVNGKRINAAQKPSSLLYKVIVSSSKEGDLVLDPFMGIGTTGLVCQRLKREFLGIERDIEQVKIAKQRLESGMIPIFY
ncbi:site-specific DNA-methyltransferase [Candidatus Parcubacteria bacterium]|nr:MAG: site-specific DNA-methyltransferase [Candidatus Parcubacteria bacterium]